MRSNCRTLHAAIRIADRGYCCRPGRIRIRRHAKSLAQVHWCGRSFTVLFWAGMAAVSAALGCGARTIDGFAALICGVFSLASISIGFSAGFGSGFGILIFGCSICTFPASAWAVQEAWGGGGVLTLARAAAWWGRSVRSARTCAPDHVLGRHSDIKYQAKNN